MEHLLLLSDGAIIGIAAGAGGAVVLIALLYGALRKATRVTWIGFQVLAAFGLLLLAGLIPSPNNEWLNFGLHAGALFLCAVIPLLAEWIVRNAMYSPKRRPARKGARVCNRVFGALAALLAFVMLFAVPGLFAIKAAEVFGVKALSAVFSNPVFAFLGKYAADLLLVSMLMIFMRAGYRLGLLRAIFYCLMFALTLGALVGAFLFTTQVGFMRSFAGLVANAIKGVHSAVAWVLGYGIVVLISFAVFFAVVMLIGALLNWLIKKIDSVRAIAFIDGLIVCLIYTAVFCALVFAVYYGAAKLAEGALSGVLPENLSAVADRLRVVGEKLSELFASSPLSGALFRGNPLNMFG